MTADLDELTAAAYRTNESEEEGKSLRDVGRRARLTFASQLPAVVISWLSSWSPAQTPRSPGPGSIEMCGTELTKGPPFNFTASSPPLQKHSGLVHISTRCGHACCYHGDQ